MPQWLPTPYRGVKYHLIEYGNRNHPTNAKELFNLWHSSLRVCNTSGVKHALSILNNEHENHLALIFT
jgi:hypothetical protein